MQFVKLYIYYPLMLICSKSQALKENKRLRKSIIFVFVLIHISSYLFLYITYKVIY